jgi:hypothetical protein
LNLQALSVHEDHDQSGPDSSVTLVVLVLSLAELLVVRKANITIWYNVSRDARLTVVNE